ncbi:FAD-binding oxidoreductase [Methylovulum miyakonense]|uniref:FAD-binding oxidoreductase n=1 Tax=Methylovulum miyakonense TaxID=645578 RepID=UPI0003659048|nr:FAD-binding oxidoreductase [Methylovulum miyakonense]
MAAISSWGRLGRWEHEVQALTGQEHIIRQLKNGRPGIAHGMGRSYGDVCLNPNGILWDTTKLDHFIRFDENTGRLHCEAGVLLRDIQRLFIPRGWILPVTPGTQFITVGGAIANDVHGKNHHVSGSFGDHIRQLTLIRSDSPPISCGPGLEPDWFAATVGGFGLTGIITEAEIQLRRVPGPWLATETLPYNSLAEFFSLADASETGWEHTVSWLDCLHSKSVRGLFMRGNPTPLALSHGPSSRKLAMPFVPPVSLVNPLSLPVLNTGYFHLKKRDSGQRLVQYEAFFYPLDNLLDWNRMYGPKGFFQYQSVVPRPVGFDAVQAMLKEIAKSGEGSFLAVLKTFGDRKPVGMMSFPQPGVTLALDFPNQGQRTHKLFGKLDAIVREAGGRIYLAKDARMPRDLFIAGYPRLSEFLQYRDPGMSSALSRRLIGE